MGRRAALAGLLLAGLACQAAPAPTQPAEAPPRVRSEPVPLPSFRAIGHRGAAGHAPENTLPALEAARELGVTEVEIDVQLSRDEVPVLFHDADLTRKTPLRGRVAEHDAEELEQADIGSWFDSMHPDASRRFAGTPLVSLDEVLERFGDTFHYHVEIKTDDPHAPLRVLEALEQHRLRRHATLTSFHLEQLQRARRLDPELPICLLVEDVDDLVAAARGDAGQAGLSASALQRRQVEVAAAENFQMVAFPARDLTRELVGEAHARGLEIRAWGVRSPADLDHALEAGADGATLDHPEWVLERQHA
jgi:glycerophosphoryl diester phosphodiesterase